MGGGVGTGWFSFGSSQAGSPKRGGHSGVSKVPRYQSIRYRKQRNVTHTEYTILCNFKHDLSPIMVIFKCIKVFF